MKASIVTHNIWPRITEATQKAGQKSYVAVAYVGTDGAALLPLKPGSKLVVDASKAAVSSGQTNPTELLELLDNGVEVYSYTELHAKVFVLGNRLFIGSSNVSVRSGERLQEAVFTSVERDVVAEGRDFVKSLCIEHLRLDRDTLLALEKIYKPPKVPQARKVDSGEVSKTYLVATMPIELSVSEQDAVKRGKKVLQSKKSGRTFRHDYFTWDKAFPANDRDVLFIVHQDGRKLLLYSEVVVLHKEPVVGTVGFVIFHSKQGNALPVSGLNKQVRDVVRSVKYCRKLTKRNVDLLRTAK